MSVSLDWITQYVLSSLFTLKFQIVIETFKQTPFYVQENVMFCV